MLRVGRVLWVAVILGTAWPGSSRAADGDQAGVVFRLRGPATVTRASAEPAEARTGLAEGVYVAVGDTVATGAKARLEIVFNDGSDIVLGENGSLVIETFEAVTDRRGAVRLALDGGALRADLTRMDGPDFTVRTPVANIGVRGTGFWAGPLGPVLGVLLLDGAVSVENQAGRVELTVPGTGTFVAAATRPPDLPSEWSPPLRAQALDQVANTIPVPPDLSVAQIANFRELLRDIVTTFADYAHARDPKFIVLARGGLELAERRQREVAIEDERARAAPPEGERLPAGTILQRYLHALDGVVAENVFCPAPEPRPATKGTPERSGRTVPPKEAKPERDPLTLLAALKGQKRVVLTLDVCRDQTQAREAGRKAAAAGYVSYAVSPPSRGLEAPSPDRPPNESARNIDALAQVRTMMVVGGGHGSIGREAWVATIGATNHDLLIADAWYNGSFPLTADHVRTLKFKALGARRLVFARINIAEAVEDRAYWQPGWQAAGPPWLVGRRDTDRGTWTVHYWDAQWRAIVGRLFADIMDRGFDGVMLEGLDAFTPFEDAPP